MQKGSWFVRPVMVDVKIGEPVETAGMTLDDRDQLIEIVRARIEDPEVLRSEVLSLRPQDLRTRET